MVAQTVKNLPTMQETWVWTLGLAIPWRRAWQPTPVFLSGEFHGQRSLVGYSPWGRQESDTSEWLALSLSYIYNVKIALKNPKKSPVREVWKIIRKQNLPILKWKVKNQRFKFERVYKLWDLDFSFWQEERLHALHHTCLLKTTNPTLEQSQPGFTSSHWRKF